MLKQILATSGLVAIAAVSTHPVLAADNEKFRQLVVEAQGTPSTDPIVKKKKTFPTLAIKPSQGIPTPTDTADAGNGNKGAKFIVAPGQGLPTPGGTPAGNGQGGTKVVQFVVAPGQGLPTPLDSGDKGKPKKEFPTLARPPGSRAPRVRGADAGADPTPPAGSKSLPLIVNAPGGIDTPPAAPTADSAPADAGAPAAADPHPASPVTADAGK